MEKWVDVIGYEGLYQVSDHGRVRSLGRKARILKTVKRSNGYLKVNLSKNGKVKNQSVHRLVATAFVSNDEDLPEVNHEDGNKENNHYSNLVWCTSSYNQKHAFANGLQKPQRGAKNGMAKINENDVKEIKRLYGTGRYSHRIIGNMFGISRQQAGRIINGDRWSCASEMS